MKRKINSKITNNLKVGKILYIKYMLLKNDEIKISEFIGICINIKNKSNSLTLQNTVKGDKLKLTICTNSPLIISMYIIKKYKKQYRLNKLYYI